MIIKQALKEFKKYAGFKAHLYIEFLTEQAATYGGVRLKKYLIENSFFYDREKVNKIPEKRAPGRLYLLMIILRR